jgi:uncharacterized protein YegP (UPF0339 family)
VRVALEVGARAGTAKVVGLWPLDGPAVQHPTLDGTHVAQVTIGGVTAVIHSFDDPLVMRGASVPEQPGHSYSRADHAVVHIDVPISAEGLAGEIAIRVADLSKVPSRPIGVEGVQALLDRSPRSVRNIALVTTAQLSAHPDWATLQLPGAPPVPPTGHYEIYVDRANKYRWRLRRPDGQIVADSGQGHVNRADCEAELRWIRQQGNNAPIRSMDLE